MFQALGTFRFADIGGQIELYQPLAEGLQTNFPPLHVPYSGNLPLLISPFIGRQQELEEVERLMAESRLVTLVGLGGFGKTRLALEAGYRAAHAFAGGAWFVDVQKDSTESSLMGRWQRLIQSSDDFRDADAREPATQRRSTLLLVDNAESSLDSVRSFAQTLLGAFANIRLLVTSREPLRLPGEILYSVPPMTLPRPNGQGDAMALLVSHLRRSPLRSRVAEMDFASLCEVCRLAEGIPLSLELIAPHFRILSEREVRDRFAELLSVSNPAMAPKHRSLQMALQSSLDMLSPRDRLALEGLSFFSGGFTLGAAEQVLEPALGKVDVLPSLGALIDSSLIQRVPGSVPRFVMLDSVRGFVRAGIESSRQHVFAAEHARWVCSFVADRAPRLLTSEFAQVYAELEAEEQNYGLALQHLVKEGASAELGKLACDLAIWWYRSNPRVGCERLKEVLESPVAFSDQTCLTLNNRLGALYICLDRVEEAQHHYQVAESLAERLQDEVALQSIRLNLGLTFQALGRPEEALRRTLPAQEFFDRQGPLRTAIKSRANLGRYLLECGRIDEAVSTLEQALSEAIANNVPETTTLCRLNLGEIELLRQPPNPQRAREQFMQIYEDGVLPEPSNQALIFEAIGFCAHYRGLHHLAGRLFGKAKGIRETRGTEVPAFERERFGPLRERAVSALGDALESLLADGRETATEQLLEEVRSAAW
jgi:tetratricopeptide (TPR) repeat protein